MVLQRCIFACLTSTATSSHSFAHIRDITAISYMPMSTRYESPLKPFHLKEWTSMTIKDSSILYTLHCSTSATIQEVRPKMTIMASFLGCQGCIHLMLTCHDICNPQICRHRPWEGLTATHGTGKDRANITTDFGIHVLCTYKMLWRNIFGDKLKCPCPISPGNEGWVALLTPHYAALCTCKTVVVNMDF